MVSVTTCPYIPSSFIAGTTAKSHWQNPWLGSKPVLAAAACLGPRVRAEGDLPDLPAESHTGSPSGIFHSVSPTITPVGKCPGSKSKWLMFTFLAITGKLSFLGGTGELSAWKMTGVKELGKGHTGRTALTRTGAFGGGLGAVCLSRGNSPCFHEAESNLE